MDEEREDSCTRKVLSLVVVRVWECVVWMRRGRIVVERHVYEEGVVVGCCESVGVCCMDEEEGG